MTVGSKVRLFEAQLSSRDSRNSCSSSSSSYLLACSAATRTVTFSHPDLPNSHSDRKGFLSHLHPKPLLVGTVKIVVQQGSLLYTNLLTDQLEGDLKRDELVRDGKLTQEEADEQAEEFSNTEWEKRWKEYPSRLGNALLKYHLVTLTMRGFELLASQFVSSESMDKLTKDTFRSARHSGKEGTLTLSSEFRAGMWANLIVYLADYAVHQAILCWIYYKYVQRTRTSRIEHKKEVESEDESVNGPLALSCLIRSSKLGMSRALGLVFAAAGGAVGSLIYPGWGTLMFSNMGDGASGFLTEGVANDLIFF